MENGKEPVPPPKCCGAVQEGVGALFMDNDDILKMYWARRIGELEREGWEVNEVNDISLFKPTTVTVHHVKNC